MKDKATLTLMELSLMLMVFALAAALCIRLFVWADETAAACNDRDRALVEVQSVAEIMKTYGGNVEEAALRFGGTWNGEVWTIPYQENWEQTETSGRFLLTVEPKESPSALLGLAEIRVMQGETCLIRMDVAWQEVSPHA